MGMLLCCWSLLGELFVRVLDMLISISCWFADARVKLLLLCCCCWLFFVSSRHPLTTPPSSLPNLCPSHSHSGDQHTMCILSRWTTDLPSKNSGMGYYFPLGRSVPNVDDGQWTRLAGKGNRDIKYLCGEATEGGTGYTTGDSLCEVTLPTTSKRQSNGDMLELNTPYFLTYYSRSLTVREELSRFLQRTTFGPTPSELDALEVAYASLQAEGLSNEEAMEQLQIEWISSQMDPTTFSNTDWNDGKFSSLRAYWRKRLNPRMAETYRIGESGPAPCEVGSRWRKFAFTDLDVINARYLRWGPNAVPIQTASVS